MTRKLALCVVTICSAAAAAAPPAPGPPATQPAWASAADFSYAERAAKSPFNGRAAADVLVLPLPYAMKVVQPGFVEKGAPLLLGGDGDALLYLVVERTAKHEEYLAQRQKLLDEKQPLKLIAWCEQNGLPECAEFEARVQLDALWDFRRPDYKPFLRKWLAYRDRIQSPWSFPLPVSGEWKVAPDTTGHHRIKHGAAYAFDLTREENGRTFAGRGARLEDHYAWGCEILAQADGVVVQVEDKFADLPPGRVGGFSEANAVIVDYGGGVRGLYAHCQQGSARVKKGDRVTAGQVLALVGNSGASGVPHLHFTLMDAGHASLKGRFTYEVRTGGKWKRIEGEDLREGQTIRPIAPPP